MKAIRWIIWHFGQLLLLLFRIKVSGLENVPAHGALLCPNHGSNWDPVLIVGSLPYGYPLHIMAKASLFRIPVVRTVIRAFGAFPVERGAKDVQAIKSSMQAIGSGENLMIFPEGTVIRNGIGKHDGLPAHAHTGISVIGVRTGATFLPVFVECRGLFRASRLIFGKPYEASVTGRHGTAEELRAIADGVLKEAYALGGQAVGGKPL